ncbi:MAG: hypothetical protein JNM86_00625 [Phycisphaerae bacterium]|nr:hypothetical protein [Phycisphaerae bacterium]MBN8596720.1 hypothetical protein [Planctomycetota bacterium]
MRSVSNAFSGRFRFLAGVAVGLGAAVAGASMLGMTPPTGLFVTDGNQVLLYTPRVVDPWKVIGVTSSVNDGRVTLYRLYENGAIDYLTPQDGPRTELGVATWTPIPIDPKLIRVRTP